jgi:hypothetical protein
MGLLESVNKWTYTSLFLVRGLDLNILELKKIGFINAFIDDVAHEPHWENCVYLLFKPEEMDEFNYWHTQEQERSELLVEDYDYEDGYIVLVYKFPEEYLREYQLFFTGDYSMFRKSYTDKFPQILEEKNQYGMITGQKKSIYNHIFNRTEELKKMWEKKLDVELGEDAEYWSVPNLDKERLDINKIKFDQLIS